MNEINCSVCKIPIKDNYCSKCGQFHTEKKVNNSSIFLDLLDSIFSVEKSLFSNLKIGIINPKKLVNNYWNGFRGYYFSPSKYIAVASLFIIINFALVKQFFIIKNIHSTSIPNQFVFLLIFIVVFTTISYFVYWGEKKSYYEHFILNFYTVSLWTILFVPISIVTKFLPIHNLVEVILMSLYILCIIIWNSRVFEISNLHRFLSVLVSVVAFGLGIYSIVKIN